MKFELIISAIDEILNVLKLRDYTELLRLITSMNLEHLQEFIARQKQKLTQFDADLLWVRMDELIIGLNQCQRELGLKKLSAHTEPTALSQPSCAAVEETAATSLTDCADGPLHANLASFIPSLTSLHTALKLEPKAVHQRMVVFYAKNSMGQENESYTTHVQQATLLWIESGEKALSQGNIELANRNYQEGYKLFLPWISRLELRSNKNLGWAIQQCDKIIKQVKSNSHAHSDAVKPLLSKAYLLRAIVYVFCKPKQIAPYELASQVLHPLQTRPDHERMAAVSFQLSVQYFFESSPGIPSTSALIQTYCKQAEIEKQLKNFMQPLSDGLFYYLVYPYNYTAFMRNPMLLNSLHHISHLNLNLEQLQLLCDKLTPTYRPILQKVIQHFQAIAPTEPAVAAEAEAPSLDTPTLEIVEPNLVMLHEINQWVDSLEAAAKKKNPKKISLPSLPSLEELFNALKLQMNQFHHNKTQYPDLFTDLDTLLCRLPLIEECANSRLRIAAMGMRLKKYELAQNIIAAYPLLAASETIRLELKQVEFEQREKNITDALKFGQLKHAAQLLDSLTDFNTPKQTDRIQALNGKLQAKLAERKTKLSAIRAVRQNKHADLELLTKTRDKLTHDLKLINQLEEDYVALMFERINLDFIILSKKHELATVFRLPIGQIQFHFKPTLDLIDELDHTLPALPLESQLLKAQLYFSMSKLIFTMYENTKATITFDQFDFKAFQAGVHYAVKECEGAMACLNEALTIAPENLEAHWQCVLVQRQLQILLIENQYLDYNLAMSGERSMTHAPDPAYVAAALLENLIIIINSGESNRHKAQLYLGSLYYLNREFEQANHVFQNLVNDAQDPSSDFARFNAGYRFFSLARLMCLAGKSALELGNYAKARRLFAEAKNWYRDNAFQCYDFVAGSNYNPFSLLYARNDDEALLPSSPLIKKIAQKGSPALIQNKTGFWFYNFDKDGKLTHKAINLGNLNELFCMRGIKLADKEQLLISIPFPELYQCIKQALGRYHVPLWDERVNQILDNSIEECDDALLVISKSNLRHQSIYAAERELPSSGEAEVAEEDEDTTTQAGLKTTIT